jgi:hypothetical protein
MNENKIEKFTPSQIEALKLLEAFLLSPRSNKIQDRVFVLKGMAGTGKTTIIRYALELLLEKDRANIDKYSETDMFNTPKVIGVTMSHKAKNVLSNSLHVVKTFASYFGLKQQYAEDGSISFKKDDWLSRDADCNTAVEVVVHDECSMYDEEMDKMVETDTHPYCKIIYMGDPGQLPPISTKGDLDSPIFSKYKNNFELKERCRQEKGNPIVELSDFIYHEIFRDFDENNDDRLSTVLSHIKKTNLIDNKGYETITYNQFLKHYKENTKDYFQSKVIAYRRDRVEFFNETIRKFVHQNPNKKFIDNELFYMNSSFQNKIKGDKHPKYICFNSDEYQILSVKEAVIDEIDVYLLYIDTKGHKHLESIQSPYVPVVSEKGIVAFKKAANARKYYATNAYGSKKGQAWKYYYDYIGQFGDVAYAYCYTGHKAQGSGFDFVYIDVNDIITVGPISNKRKLQAIYTALTRAKIRATFLKSNNNE